MHDLVSLTNGLKVATVSMPHMQSVALGIWIRAGGRYESSKNNGISHFLEHMVFKGTKARSGKDIKESIEGIGGTLNGFTGEESTCYFVKMTNEHIDMGLDVLSDMVLNPKLNKADIQNERSVILEEIKMYMDLPNHYVHDLLSSLMWPDHSLGLPLAGTFETVKKIGQDNLYAYKKKFYSPHNIVIACCGKMNAPDFVDKVRTRFKKAKNQPLVHSHKVSGKQTRLRSNFLYRDTKQTHLALGFHGLSIFHPDRYAMDLLHVIMGGNMSSRLFHEVREKRGLAYDISTSSKHYNDTGSFVVSAGINNKELAGALDIILREFRKISKKRINPGEFQRAKDFCRGQLLMGLENTLSCMTWVGEKVTTGDPMHDIDAVLERLDKVTVEDVRRVALETFRKANTNIAIIGPVGKAARIDIERKFREGLN